VYRLHITERSKLEFKKDEDNQQRGMDGGIEGRKEGGKK
jgi:hypothetical protein